MVHGDQVGMWIEGFKTPTIPETDDDIVYCNIRAVSVKLLNRATVRDNAYNFLHDGLVFNLKNLNILIQYIIMKHSLL